MNKWWCLVLATPMLAGCGPGPADLAVAACQREVAEKVAGKSYDLDLADMAAKFRAVEGSNIGEITSKVTFGRGLPSESAQSFTCKVQFNPNAPGGEPAVIGLTFLW